LVVYDDLDLPLGKLRIKRGGSSGGHHGIDSIIAELGSSNFLRLRVGIGSGKSNTIDHVLGWFDSGESELALTMVRQSAEAVKVILSRGSARAANQFNGLDYAGVAADESAGGAGDVVKEN
ncbi:MAG: aminoacyl-tRNA hydrolase, partial [Victivallaceae bacterium]